MSWAFYINVRFIHKCPLYTLLCLYKVNSIGNIGNCSDYCKWFYSINNFLALNDFRGILRTWSGRSSVRNCECCLRSQDSVWPWGVGACDWESSGRERGGAGFWCLVNVLFLDPGIDYTGVFCLCKFSQLYTYGLHSFMSIFYSSIKKTQI